MKFDNVKYTLLNRCIQCACFLMFKYYESGYILKGKLDPLLSYLILYSDWSPLAAINLAVFYVYFINIKGNEKEGQMSRLLNKINQQ